MAEPFVLKDCALIGLATGQRAYGLRDFTDRVAHVHPDCIYHHIWGSRLRPGFEEPEHMNDFAEWADRGLHDDLLAERLNILSPTDFGSLKELRLELVEILEERMDDPASGSNWARASKPFFFIRSQMVVFDTGIRGATVEELADLLPRMSVGSIYYHFIDARIRTEEHGNDFGAWIAGLGDGHEALVEELKAVDPYFLSLTELRAQLTSRFLVHMGEAPGRAAKWDSGRGAAADTGRGAA